MKRMFLLTAAIALMAVGGAVVACGGGGKAEPAADETGPDGVASAEPEESAGGPGDKLAALLAGVDPPSSYEVSSDPPGDEPPVTMIVKMDGQKPAKVKMIHRDGWMLVDLEAGATYAFEPREDMIMKLPLGSGAQQAANSPSDHVDPDATTIGVEIIDGVKCWVIRSTVGNLESKVWVGAEDGLPRQLEADEGLTRFVYSRIDRIADSEFALPDGIEVVDMVEMMQHGFKQPD